MTDLYNEILKLEQVPKTIEEFVEEIVEDPTVRDSFVEDFVDEIIESMSPQDIIRAYADTLYQDILRQCDENEEESIVQECAEHYPQVLNRFGVTLTEENVDS